MLYSFFKNILFFVYHIIFRIDVQGRENVPISGAVILCSNHRSNNDAIILAISQKRKLSFMAKDSLFRVPILGFFLKKVGTFPVKRGSGDIAAVKKAIEILNEDNVLSIFPEGTRNKTHDDLLEFKTGAVFIAYKANAAIVPCAIKGRYIPFSKIKVRFGSPFYVDTSERKPDVHGETEKLKNAVEKLYLEG